MSWAAFGMGALGRLVGNLSDTYGTGDTKEEKDRKDAESDYLARERLGIQARVEGAKAAGLHPLVAMNYQGGNSPSQIIGGGGDIVPQGDFRAEAKSDPNIDRYNAARARLAEAEATKAERDLAASQRALATQPGQAIPAVVPSLSTTSPANLSVLSSGKWALKPGITLKPEEVVAGTGGLTAGTHQGMTVFEMPWGTTWTLPGDKLSQALEDLDLAKYYAVLRANLPREWERLQPSTPEHVREMDSLRRRYPPKGNPAKWPPRMHGGKVTF